MKKKAKKVLKTITLEVMRDNPEFSICNGHVDAQTFNRAFEAEGWSDGDVTNADLHHEYWKRLKCSWKKSEQSDYKAQAVTVMYW